MTVSMRVVVHVPVFFRIALIVELDIPAFRHGACAPEALVSYVCQDKERPTIFPDATRTQEYLDSRPLIFHPKPK